ncbi:MAG: hypothetical protein ACRER2_14915 [Methylococcales bacterium]
MEHLQEELDRLIESIPDNSEFRTRLDNLTSIYPFNDYEFIIAHLVCLGILTLESYYDLRDRYIERNLYLYVFEISAPRTFGESWAQGHLKQLVPELVKPSKKSDHNYSGQYDFYLDEKIRIEVKASRAVDDSISAPLYVKALSSDSKKGFWMNFQQIKPACCDVFIWIAVWRDLIRYWVLSSQEVETNQYYSVGQHRGNIGEGQLHVTHENFGTLTGYLVEPRELLQAIRNAYKRQISNG